MSNFWWEDEEHTCLTAAAAMRLLSSFLSAPGMMALRSSTRAWMV